MRPHARSTSLAAWATPFATHELDFVTKAPEAPARRTSPTEADEAAGRGVTTRRKNGRPLASRHPKVDLRVPRPSPAAGGPVAMRLGLHRRLDCACPLWHVLRFFCDVAKAAAPPSMKVSGHLAWFLCTPSPGRDTHAHSSDGSPGYVSVSAKHVASWHRATHLLKAMAGAARPLVASPHV